MLDPPPPAAMLALVLQDEAPAAVLGAARSQTKPETQGT